MLLILRELLAEGNKRVTKRRIDGGVCDDFSRLAAVAGSTFTSLRNHECVRVKAE